MFDCNAKYFVFVDFDGVLTSERVHYTNTDDAYDMWAQFDPIAMQFFNKIHNTYDSVKFVWTTSWRNHISQGGELEHILYSMWYNAGFRGFFGDPWRVNPDDCMIGEVTHRNRAHEIKHYLENYGQGHKDFIIFDDNDYNFNQVLGIKRFVKTDYENGILYKHMKHASSLMGTWDKKCP